MLYGHVWLVTLLLPLLSAISSKEALVTINTKKWLHLVHDKFLSLAFTPEMLLNMPAISSSTVHMARSLTPAYLRIGGPDTNSLSFLPESESGLTNGTTINESQWTELNMFTSKVGLDLLICLNAEQRVQTVWDSGNTLKLISASDKRAFNMSFQLGYELPRMGAPDRVSGSDMGRDVVRLRMILDAFPRYAEFHILGPDISLSQSEEQLQDIKDLLYEAGGALTALTYHPHLSLMDDEEDNMSALMQQLGNVITKDSFNKLGYSIKKPLWLADSGYEKMTGEFSDALRWIHRLGTAARLGYQVILHQPPVISIHQPTPDYWVSVLYKSLVGRAVLETRLLSGNFSAVQVFSHCACATNAGTTTSSSHPSILDPEWSYERGAIVVFGSNTATQPLRLTIKASLKEEPVHLFVLTEDAGQDGLPRKRGSTLLNGQRLSMSPTGELPILTPKVRRTGRTLTINIAAHSAFFLVLPETKVRICTLYPATVAEERIDITKRIKFVVPINTVENQDTLTDQEAQETHENVNEESSSEDGISYVSFTTRNKAGKLDNTERRGEDKLNNLKEKNDSEMIDDVKQRHISIKNNVKRAKENVHKAITKVQLNVKSREPIRIGKNKLVKSDEIEEENKQENDSDVTYVSFTDNTWLGKAPDVIESFDRIMADESHTFVEGDSLTTSEEMDCADGICSLGQETLESRRGKYALLRAAILGKRNMTQSGMEDQHKNPQELTGKEESIEGDKNVKIQKRFKRFTNQQFTSSGSLAPTQDFFIQSPLANPRLLIKKKRHESHRPVLLKRVKQGTGSGSLINSRDNLHTSIYDAYNESRLPFSTKYVYARPEIDSFPAGDVFIPTETHRPADKEIKEYDYVPEDFDVPKMAVENYEVDAILPTDHKTVVSKYYPGEFYEHRKLGQVKLNKLLSNFKELSETDSFDIVSKDSIKGIITNEKEEKSNVEVVTERFTEDREKKAKEMASKQLKNYYEGTQSAALQEEIMDYDDLKEEVVGGKGDLGNEWKILLKLKNIGGSSLDQKEPTGKTKLSQYKVNDTKTFGKGDIKNDFLSDEEEASWETARKIIEKHHSKNDFTINSADYVVGTRPIVSSHHIPDAPYGMRYRNRKKREYVNSYVLESEMQHYIPEMNKTSKKLLDSLDKNASEYTNESINSAAKIITQNLELEKQVSVKEAAINTPPQESSFSVNPDGYRTQQTLKPFGLKTAEEANNDHTGETKTEGMPLHSTKYSSGEQSLAVSKNSKENLPENKYVSNNTIQSSLKYVALVKVDDQQSMLNSGKINELSKELNSSESSVTINRALNSNSAKQMEPTLNPTEKLKEEVEHYINDSKESISSLKPQVLQNNSIEGSTELLLKQNNEMIKNIRTTNISTENDIKVVNIKENKNDTKLRDTENILKHNLLKSKLEKEETKINMSNGKSEVKNKSSKSQYTIEKINKNLHQGKSGIKTRLTKLKKIFNKKDNTSRNEKNKVKINTKKRREIRHNFFISNPEEHFGHVQKKDEPESGENYTYSHHKKQIGLNETDGSWIDPEELENYSPFSNSSKSSFNNTQFNYTSSHQARSTIPNRCWGSKSYTRDSTENGQHHRRAPVISQVPKILMNEQLYPVQFYRLVPYLMQGEAFSENEMIGGTGIKNKLWNVCGCSHGTGSNDESRHSKHDLKTSVEDSSLETEETNDYDYDTSAHYSTTDINSDEQYDGSEETHRHPHKSSAAFGRFLQRRKGNGLTYNVSSQQERRKRSAQQTDDVNQANKGGNKVTHFDRSEYAITKRNEDKHISNNLEKYNAIQQNNRDYSSMPIYLSQSKRKDRPNTSDLNNNSYRSKTWRNEIPEEKILSFEDSRWDEVPIATGMDKLRNKVYLQDKNYLYNDILEDVLTSFGEEEPAPEIGVDALDYGHFNEGSLEVTKPQLTESVKTNNLIDSLVRESYTKAMLHGIDQSALHWFEADEHSDSTKDESIMEESSDISSNNNWESMIANEQIIRKNVIDKSSDHFGFPINSLGLDIVTDIPKTPLANTKEQVVLKKTGSESDETSYKENERWRNNGIKYTQPLKLSQMSNSNEGTEAHLSDGDTESVKPCSISNSSRELLQFVISKLKFMVKFVTRFMGISF